MSTDFTVIAGDSINEFINSHHDAVYDSVKSAYLAHEEQKTVNPNSYFLRFPEKPAARIIALPAAISAENKISGIKWIASYPDNIKMGRPRASAAIILNDYETGYPIACLEGSIISAVRTACSAVLAAECLNNQVKKLGSIGFVGTSFIAKHIYSCFMKQKWHFDKINVFDLDQNTSQMFSQFVAKNSGHSQIEVMKSHEDVLKKSDLIVFTTTAAKPYIEDVACFEHSPIVLHVSLRDLAPSILANANNIVDDVEHVLSSATSADLTYQQYKTKEFINGTIGQLIKNELKLAKTKPSIFSPMGMGILDLAVANLVYQKIANEFKFNINNFHPTNLT